MSSRLEGTQCKGMSFKRGLSRHGHKHWLSYPRQCERCLSLLVSSMRNWTHRELPFFFTALFSAYLGATVTNMLSVVSSVLAKVFCPKTDLNTVNLPGLWGKTPRFREQFSQTQNWSGRGDTVCPGGWCGSHWNRPLTIITTFPPWSLHELPQLSLQHLWDNCMSILCVWNDWEKGPPHV